MAVRISTRSFSGQGAVSAREIVGLVIHRARAPPDRYTLAPPQARQTMTPRPGSKRAAWPSGAFRPHSPQLASSGAKPRRARSWLWKTRSKVSPSPSSAPSASKNVRVRSKTAGTGSPCGRASRRSSSATPARVMRPRCERIFGKAATTTASESRWSSPRPSTRATSMTLYGSRDPAKRRRLFRAPRARAETLPKSAVSSVRMRSESP